MKRKYMFFDIDGTLTTGTFPEVIPEETRHTVQMLKQNHFVAIATGRPYRICQSIADETGIGTVVCNGGNCAVVNGRKLFDYPLEQASVEQVLKECSDFGIPFAVSVDESENYVTSKQSFYERMGEAPISSHVKFDAKFDYTLPDYIIRVIVLATKEEEKKLSKHKNVVGQRYSDLFLMYEPDDKYKGIAALSEILDFPECDVVVFGDGKNDIKMFRQAPLSIAMGNADEELKEIATYITTGSDDNGIYHACRHFGWI